MKFSAGPMFISFLSCIQILETEVGFVLELICGGQSVQQLLMLTLTEPQ